MLLFRASASFPALIAATFALAACQSSTSGSPEAVSSISAAPVSFASSNSGNLSGFDLTSRGGSEFTIPVTSEDSYSNAAVQALDRCAQSGQKPTAPMQRVVGGKTVLAYSCS